LGIWGLINLSNLHPREPTHILAQSLAYSFLKHEALYNQALFEEPWKTPSLHWYYSLAFGSTIPCCCEVWLNQ
jgi:hypothetical protein